MANLYVRDFPDELMAELNILAITRKTTLKQLVPTLLAQAVKTSDKAGK